MRRWLRRIHRWLGLLMALQIIAWMVSGFYFSLIPITEIRGEHLTADPPALSPAQLSGTIPPQEAWDRVAAGLSEPAELSGMTLHAGDDGTWYRVSGVAGGRPFARRVNGATGQVASRLSSQEAEARAKSLLKEPGQVRDVRWIEQVPPGHEVRGRALPVWEIRFVEPEQLSLYLDPWTGELLARRTTRWRVFDFLWMLHIMDYEARDDFNTPLLQWSAAAGLLVAVSGVVFWAMTTRLRRRRLRPR